MIYRTYAKYPKELPKDKLLGLIVHNHDREKFIQLTKGLKLTARTIKPQYDGNNVTRNLITVIVEYDAFRIPRFVKNNLLKKIKPSNISKLSINIENSVFG